MYSHPVSCAEVNSFCKVVALIEATMVSSGKGHHKFPCTLIGPVHLEGENNYKYTQHDQHLIKSKINPKIHATYRDTVLHEDIGIHDGDQLVEQVRLGVKQLWCQLLHDSLQLLCCRGWHSIPRLRFTPGQRNRKQEVNIFT